SARSGLPGSLEQRELHGARPGADAEPRSAQPHRRGRVFVLRLRESHQHVEQARAPVHPRHSRAVLDPPLQTSGTSTRRRHSIGSLSRLTFGKTILGLSIPLILPSQLLAAWPNSRIRVAQIGCGRIARDHDMPGVLASGMADIVAVCDVDAHRAASGKEHLEALYRKAHLTVPPISVHGDYREIIERKDIDALVISTPDHWHAEPALAAVLAGKDVYLQKPFTMTIAEGIVLRDAVARTKRILQVGSQQRSWKQFRQAAELIRSGRIGQVRRVEIGLPIDPTAPDDPVQP